MPVDPRRKSPSDEPTVDLITCPLCQGKLLREPRRTVDRLRSLFGPVKRYRCENFACQWEGNVSNHRTDVSATGKPYYRPVSRNSHRRSGRVPVAFVVHMVLVAVGAVFVIVVSTTEPTSWIGDGEFAIGTRFYDPVPERSADRTASR